VSFKVPIELRDYFRLIDDQASHKFKYLFDKYYLCLMIGLQNVELGKEEDIENAEFIDHYPEPYADKAELITGLLINAEMERQCIEPDARESIQSLILKLIDNNSPTKLSMYGNGLLNSYAAGGMNIIRENIPKTNELETFLVFYHRLINAS
jgi:hypothetical protein